MTEAFLFCFQEKKWRFNCWTVQYLFFSSAWLFKTGIYKTRHTHTGEDHDIRMWTATHRWQCVVTHFEGCRFWIQNPTGVTNVTNQMSPITTNLAFTPPWLSPLVAPFLQPPPHCYLHISHPHRTRRRPQPQPRQPPRKWPRTRQRGRAGWRRGGEVTSGGVTGGLRALPWASLHRTRWWDSTTGLVLETNENEFKKRYRQDEDAGIPPPSSSPLHYQVSQTRRHTVCFVIHPPASGCSVRESRGGATTSIYVVLFILIATLCKFYTLKITCAGKALLLPVLVDNVKWTWDGLSEFHCKGYHMTRKMRHTRTTCLASMGRVLGQCVARLLVCRIFFLCECVHSCLSRLCR